MNTEKVRSEIQNAIAENRSHMTGKQIRKQYAPGKAQLAKLAELGILNLMPVGFGFSDADAVIRAATENKSAIMNAYGEGEEVAASALSEALNSEPAEITIQMSDSAPHQSLKADFVGNSASAAGDNLHIWHDQGRGWCGCFSGVTAEGLFYESDDYTGFASQAEAISYMRSVYVPNV